METEERGDIAEQAMPVELTAELDAARKEATDNHDKYLRALAEAENMRKRLERLGDERIWQEKRRIFGHLLDLADQLEQALKYADEADPVSAGVRVTYQQLQKILTQEGVQAMTPVGEVFDPTMHEAVELADRGERGPNQVVSEYRKGYTLNGRLLRAARVQVTKES